MTKAKPRRRPHSIDFSNTVSLTQQEFTEECDVNNIVKKYQQTGVLPRGYHGEPRYGYAPALDFREALELVMSTEEHFMSLPSEVRQRFENDPGELLAFLDDPENLEEARQLGLAKKGDSDSVVQAEDEEEAAAPSPSPEAPLEPPSGEASSEA